MTPLSAASFDAYVMLSHLTPREAGAKRSELHSIVYLACLLSIYDGREADWWLYDFATTTSGAPYAEALDDALRLMESAAATVVAGEVVTLTDRGERVHRDLAQLPSLRDRSRYLEPACAVTLALPLPAVTEGIVNEPQLRAAIALGQVRHLLDDQGRIVLADHFDGLRSVLAPQGASSDLLVAAIVWLTYLTRSTSIMAAANAD